MKVLVIDDDETTRFLVSQMVSVSGLKPIVCKNGKQAWEKYQEELYHFIICDWMMPEMDGIEFCKLVRGSDTSEYSFILMLTSRNQPDDLKQILEAGANDYLAKPIDAELLRIRITVAGRAVHQIIARKKAEELLKQSNKDLLHAQKLIQFDIQLAGLVQGRCLSFPEWNIPFLRVHTFHRPYDKVTGDILLPRYTHDRFEVFLGDATGHGVAAAFMTMVVNQELAQIDWATTPSQLLDQLNERISFRIGEIDLFMTALYLRVNPQGQVDFADAGHLPVLYLPKSPEPLQWLKKPGLALGIFSRDEETFFNYKENSLQLNAGDRLMLLTDGILEVIDENHQPFGKSRLLEIMHDVRYLTNEQIINAILAALQRFGGPNGFSDDATMIVLEYTG